MRNHKSLFKKSPEELQEHLYQRKRGFIKENKKGRGSYSRKQKHKEKFDNDKNF